MTMSERVSSIPSPQTTLVIIFGASQWPYDPVEFPTDTAFEKAAEKIEKYFTQSFGVPEGNLLQLFNTDSNAIEIEKEIYKYLGSKKLERSARDVIIYYIGHAKRTNKYRQLYLAIKDTQEHNPEGTSLKVESLARTVQMQTRGLRRFYIFDCCFSANAIPDLQGPKETDLLRNALDDAEGNTQGFTALFSSSMSEASVILPNHTNTFFTEALLQVVLSSNIPSNRPLSFSDVYDEINLRLRSLHREYRLSYPMMEIPPDAQIYPGDIAKVPLFPNLGFQQDAHRSDPTETNQAPIQEQILFTHTSDIKGAKLLKRRKSVIVILSMIVFFILVGAIISISIFTSLYGKQNKILTPPVLSHNTTTPSIYNPQLRNLLVNGSFTQGIKGWKCTSGLDIQNITKGNMAWIQVYIPKDQGHLYICGQSILIRPQSGMTYTASILVRAANSTTIPITGGIALWINNDTSSNLNTNQNNPFIITDSSKWASDTVSFHIPDSLHTYMSFEIDVDNSTGVSLDIASAQVVQDH